MIDIEEVKKEFYKFTQNYDQENNTIQRKIGHSIRVMKNSNKIAKKLGLDEEKVEIATLIGILHDVGRFEQEKIYHTLEYNQKIDHGDIGAEMLFAKNEIRKYIKYTKYDQIIKTGIQEHSKYKINRNLPKEEMLFTQIIRDADKLDIFYECTEIFWKTEIEKINKEKITDKVYEQFKLQKTVEDINRVTRIDLVVREISLIYDIEFKETLEIIKQEKYIDKIIDRFDFKDKETKEKMEEIRKIVNQYIEKRST